MSAQPARSAFATARPLPRPAVDGARARALKLVAPVRSRARRAPFVVVVLGLLSSGLVGLIVISTTLQDQAFELAELNRQSNALNVQQQQLTQEVDRLGSPAALAEKAVRLGMVPNSNPVFLRTSDGTVIGKPHPAERGSNVKRVDR